MANPNDNLRRLYQNGLKHFSLPDFDTFSQDMKDEEKRRRFYTNMQDAYSLPDFDTFSKDIGAVAVEPVQTTTTTTTQPQQQSTSATVKPITDTTAQQASVTSASQPAPAQGWKPSPAQQLEFNRQMDEMQAERQQQRQQFEQRMDDIKKGNRPGAFMGEREFNPQTGKMDTRYYTTQGERVGTQMEQSHKNTEYHHWWEDNTEAGQRSKEQRLQREDERRQQVFDSSLASLWSRHNPQDGLNAAEQAWSVAEERQMSVRNRNAKKHWDSYAAMGGGREMRVVTTSMNRHDDAVAHLTNFDLDRLMNDAWENLGEDGQQALIDDCHQMLRYRNPGTDDLTLYQQAKELARQQSDLRLYNLAVEKNLPQNNLEYLMRKIGDANLLNSISKGLAVSSAGTTGDMAAYEAANEQYRQDGHKIIDVVGTVSGMALDPTMWISGGVGSAATKSAMWAGGRRLAGRGATAAVTNAATRQFATSMTGRVVGGVVGGAANFGAFEGIKEMENQFAHGGVVRTTDENGNLLREGRYVNDGYSAGAVGKQALHGLGMGAAVGWLTPVSGNVADKLVRGGGKIFGKEVGGIASTAGKVGTRAGMYAGATTLEGTIFSIPEWMDGNRDGFDVWTDNMAMMVGFKAKHMIKTAGGVLGDLQKSFESPANGRKNRLDFESRLRQRMDAPSDGGLALTKDEEAELKRYGYDLRELVESAEKTGNAAEGSLIAENAPEIVSRLTDMVYDPRISEAARAKMYYYATGRKLPESTIMRGEMYEDGNGGFVVESQGANGVITSRTFTSRKAADLELERIKRQTELNQVEFGEFYQQNVADFNQRLLDACRRVAAKNSWNSVEVYKVYERIAGERIGKEPTPLEGAQHAIYRKVQEEMGDFAPTTKITDDIRGRINEKYGVDIDNAIRKDGRRRTDAEQGAIDEYITELFPKRESVFAEEGQKKLNGRDESQIVDIEDNEVVDLTDGGEPRVDADPHEPNGEQKPIGRAVMKYQDRQVEVLSGRVTLTDDGTMIDNERSDNSIVIRDIATGKVEMVSPETMLSYEAISLADDEKELNLQSNSSNNGNGFEQDNGGSIGQEGAYAGGRVVGDSTSGVAGNRDRGYIRVYEEGLDAERDEYSSGSERARRDAEAERLIGIARENGQYIDKADFGLFGDRLPKSSGESVVYTNKEQRKVYKVKDPAAKSPMKGNVQPEDVIYEHLVHNKYFPETAYGFEGISDEAGDVRVVLSQDYIDAVDNATDEQIVTALAEKGLYPEGNYRYGNDEVSVTDVTGDNALVGADGKVYFIDPIIDFKKPVKEILGNEGERPISSDRIKYTSGQIKIRNSDGSETRGVLTGYVDEEGKHEYYVEGDLQHLHYATESELDNILSDYLPDAPQEPVVPKDSQGNDLAVGDEVVLSAGRTGVVSEIKPDGSVAVDHNGEMVTYNEQFGDMTATGLRKVVQTPPVEEAPAAPTGAPADPINPIPEPTPVPAQMTEGAVLPNGITAVGFINVPQRGGSTRTFTIGKNAEGENVVLDESGFLWGHDGTGANMQPHRPGSNVPIWTDEQIAQFGAVKTPNEQPTTVSITPETVPNPVGNAAPVVENVPEAVSTVEPTPLQRIPRDEKGNPIFEQAESPEAAWDALVEFSEGDAGAAKEIADVMVEEKRKAFEKAQKLKSKGKTPTEILASRKANAAELTNAQAEFEYWQKMAAVEQNRQAAIRTEQEAEARRLAVERAEQDKAEKAAREEAERIERESLEGIPEWHMDTPENARVRGSRRFSGQLFMRQEPVQGVPGKEVEVKFSQDALPTGRVAVIEAGQLQPSHLQGQRNPMFFIEEAQPKNRSEAVSAFSAQQIAEGIRPEEITGSATAYTGAPTVNTRGEVIQGNNRSDALRYLWENNLPRQQAAYKQYLLDNAEQLGIDPEAVNTMQQPVLVNMLDVDDAEAIRLGQMTAQDTESGGIERIKPKNVAQKLGDSMRQFANMLLRSGDEEASFGQLVDRNGTEVLKWMSQLGAISNTQYQSAFDSKGNLTAEAKNDLQKVLYQAVFKGGSPQLEEMFDRLPVKAQRALLSTAFRDMDSPFAGKLLPEIQASIAAYNQLMLDPVFAEAKKMEEVLRAIEAFKSTIALDDRFEQYSPADNFSNFALHLAAMYKASDMSQSTIAGYFTQMYDLAQGKKEATLFEEADTTEYPLADVIKKVLNIDYQPAKNGNNNVANGGADVALLNQVGQGGELRGNEPPASGEQTPAGTEPSDRGAGVEDDSAAAGGRNTDVSGRKTDDEANGELAEGVTPSVGPFGEIYTQFKGKPQEAVTFLLAKRSGEAIGALHHKDIGDIDLVWGKEGTAHSDGYGLAKLAKFHPEVLFNLQEILNDMVVTKRSTNRVQLESDKYQAAVRLTWDDKKKTWLLTMFEKKNSVPDNTTDTVETLSSNGNDTATPENTVISSDVRSVPAVGEGTNTDTSEVNSGQTEGATAPAGNSSQTSDSKDNNSLTEEQISSSTSSEAASPMTVQPSVQTSVQAASAEVNLNPTPAQAEAGNYKKGHVTIGDFDITIENPAGSIRKGVDANGKRWETTMANAYGYIKGTESVDGDHIDVFLHTDMDEWNGRKVYVVDQTRPDGSFDEHKVMLGFNDKDAAMSAYLANYDETWAEKHPELRISEVNIEDFNKWIKSSHRKTKPFADYRNIKALTEEVGQTRTHINDEGVIVDGDGKPMTLYHGTPNDVGSVTDLEAGHQRGKEDGARFNGDGVSFTPDRTVAEDYAHDGDTDWKVFEANVRLSNPYYTVGVAHFTPEEAAEFTAGLKAKGHDGIINYPSKAMREIGAAPAEVIVFGKESIIPIESEVQSMKSEGYSIEARKDTRDNSDLFAVKFEERVGKEEFKGQKAIAKKHGGYWSNFGKKGFLFKSEADAKAFAAEVMGKSEDDIADEAPLSMADISEESPKPDDGDRLIGWDESGPEENPFLNVGADKPTEMPTPRKRSKWISDEDAAEFDNLRSGLRSHLGTDTPDIVREDIPSYGHKKSQTRNRQDLTTPPAKAEVASSSLKGLAKLQKVAEKLAVLKKKIDGKTSHRGVISELASAVMADSQGYSTIVTANGNEVHIRISNHNANAEHFERRGHNDDNVSIVIKSRRTANTFRPHPEVELTEYVYTTEAIKADSNILSQVAESLRQMIETGEYVDLSGKALVNRSPETDIVMEDTPSYGKPQPKQMDAEVLRMGTRMTYLMMKGGLRKFSDYAEAMVDEVGDAIRPHLKSLYAAAQNMEEVMQLGWDEEMDDRNTVKSFDVYNFDKPGAKDIIETAQHIVDEQQSQRQTQQLIDTLKDKRNEQRKKEADETSADTEIVVDKAEATASKVESELQGAKSEEDAERLNTELDKEIEAVNKQLALLGYYEADLVEKDFNEAYGYMRNAERKATQDAHRLAMQLAADLGLSLPAPKDKVKKSKPYGFGSKVAKSNIAPAGGEVSITLPLAEDKELSVVLFMEPNAEWLENGKADGKRDDLVFNGGYFRVENPNGKGFNGRYLTSNNDINADVTYDELLADVRHAVRHLLPSEEDEVKRMDGERRLSVGKKADGNREVYEAAKGMLEAAGVAVHEVSGEDAQAMFAEKDGARMSAAKRRALDTMNGGSAQQSNGTGLRTNHQDPVVSFDYVANIQKELGTLADKYDKIAKEHTFIGDLSKALGLRNNGNHSNYGTFEAKNGTIVRIRISDHNAEVKNFDDAGYDNGISIVVSRKANEGLNNNGEAHIVEYFYNGYKLAKADGHPLAEIARSMQQVLYSGEFKDTTGLAERQEVNGGGVRELRDGAGTVYGWVKDGEVYLNRDAMNPETPVHEYTHLWDAMVQRENPELWARGKELMKETPLWDEVVNDPNYADIRDDEDAVASEVHSRLSGERGSRILDGMIDDARKEGAFAEAEAVTLVSRLRRWLREMFDGLKATLGRWSKRDLRNLTTDDFVKMTLRDLAEGLNPNHGGKGLVTLHNISEGKLRKALKAGGLANPSMAVVRAGLNSHEGYGSITLVARGSIADKRSGRNAGTWAGDAWTPMYPPVEREQSALDRAAVVSDISRNIPQEMRGLVTRGWESHLSGGNESSLAYWFLSERGAAPEIARRQRKYSPALSDKVLGLVGDREVTALSADEGSELRRLYIVNELDGDASKYDKFMELSMKSAKERLGKPSGLMRMKAEVSIDMMERQGLLPSISTWVNDIRSDERMGERVDEYKTSADANAIIGDKGLTGEFERWVEELDKRYGVEEKLFAGYTASGYRRLVPNTVENASRIMRSQGRNASHGGTGFSMFVASVLKPMSTHGQMRGQSDRLSDSHAGTEEFDKKWGDVYYDLAVKCQPDAERISDDYGFYRLMEAAEKRDPAKHLKDEYGIELSAEDISRLSRMMDAIREERPVKYFETKFERPVGIEEFAAAVVPEGTDPEIVKSLKDAGLQVKTYSPEKDGDRQRAVAQASNEPGVRFHAAKSGADHENGDKKSLLKNRQDLTTRSEELLAPSSSGSAKLQKLSDNLRVLAEKYSGQTSPHGALTDLAQAIDAKGDGVSKYAKIELPHGEEAHVRLSNHNANAATYAERGNNGDNVSIVIKSRRTPNTFRPHPDVELTEYVYTTEAIRKDGGLLSQVAKSLRKMIESGEYVDLSGKAIVNHSRSANDEGMLFEPGSEYGASANSDIRFRLGDSRESFSNRQQSAVENRGTVMPGLNDAEVKVVDVPKHQYKGDKVLTQAVDAATKRYKGNVLHYDNYGSKFDYSISKNGLVYASNHADKSDNVGVHAAVMDKLDTVINNSIEVMEHADVFKDENGRSENNGYNPNALMHRFVGAIRIDGKHYRVISTLKEFSDNKSNKQHTYEVTKIEVLNSYEPSTLNGTEVQTKSHLRTANLLKDAEIHNKSGEKILQESMIADERMHQQEMAQTSPEAKGGHAERMAKKFNTPIRIVEDPTELTHDDPEMQKRMRGSKGFYNPTTGEVVVVVPNNATVEDVAETVFHEVVAHKGLREIIGEENYDAFCDEVYDHLKDDLKQQIDEETTRRFVNEPGKGYEHHRRVAVDEMFGRMSEKGFEDFTKAERGIWAKLKAKVLEAINKFLGSLKLPKWVKLGDNELRYMLWRSHERLTNKSDYVDMARDAAKRSELGLDDGALMREGREVHELRRVNDRFNEQLEKLSNGVERNGELKLGKPGAVLRSAGIDGSGIFLQWNVLQKKMNPSYVHNHPFAIDDIKDLPLAINHPIAVFESHGHGDFNILVGLQKDGKNFVVSLQAKRKSVKGGEIEVDDIVTLYPKEEKGIIYWINNGLAKVFDKEKALEWLRTCETHNRHSAVQELEDATKVVKNFENPTIETPESDLRFRASETGDIWKDRSVGLEERITNAAIRLANNQAADLTLRNDAMRAVTNNLQSLLHSMRNRRGTTQSFAGADRKVEAGVVDAMNAQARYDRSTVKRVADLARILIQYGYLDDMTGGEVRRLLSAVKNATAMHNTAEYVEKILDIMIGNQLRNAEGTLHKLLSIRGSKVNASGVEVQGALDVKGQMMVARLKELINEGLKVTEDRDDFDKLIADAEEALSDESAIKRDNAEIELEALYLARQYATDISASKEEEKQLRKLLKDAEIDHKEGRMADDAYQQYAESVNNDLLSNRIARIDGFFNLVGRLSGGLRESIDSAKAWREAQKERVNQIHHYANSDLEGIPYRTERMKKTFGSRLSNSALAKIFMAPAATMEQVCRLLGSKSVDGNGYLKEMIVDRWQECRDKEWVETQKIEEMLDAKAKDVAGVKHWSDLYKISTKKAGAVSWKDGNEIVEHKVKQGNLMYIYMVDKMNDGCRLLRRMGITEDDVANAVSVLDPQLKEIADWVQEELLPNLREKYNETHKRLFGAPMVKIDNYVPLRINKSTIEDKTDLSENTSYDGNGLPKVYAKAYIKRTMHNHPVDILGTDPISLTLEHIREMETTDAFAEYRRDLTTLLRYGRFRNRLRHMKTIYGSGDDFDKLFFDLAMLVGGAYKPRVGTVDKALVNITKLATGACVALNLHSAIKQLLSYPAFGGEAASSRLLANMVRPKQCIEFCLENIPAMQRRWGDKLAGNDVLRDWDGDWDWTNTKFVKKLQRGGLTPNAFIDLLTCCMGTEAVYHSKFDELKEAGYNNEIARQKAIVHSEQVFNLSQQSNEVMYLSLLQNNRSYLTTYFVNFRNSVMGYLRQSIQSKRELLNMATNKAKILEFEKKKLERSGLSSEQAEAYANKKFNRNWARNLIKSLNFDYILPALWVLAPYMWYLIFGDDKEKKKEILVKASKRGTVGALEGMVGGGTVPDLIYNFAIGEKFNFDEETSPFMGQLSETINAVGRGDKIGATNHFVNFALSAGLSINPQRIEDLVATSLDYFGKDDKTRRDFEIFAMRLLCVPQSQVDMVYFDEVALTARGAGQLTADELAERFANYKLMHNEFATVWFYNDEQKAEQKDRFKKQVISEAKRQLPKHINTDEINTYIQWSDSVSERETALRNLKKKAINNPEHWQQYHQERKDLYQGNNIGLHKFVKKYKHDMKLLTERWLSSDITKPQADSIVHEMLSRREHLLDALHQNPQPMQPNR